MVAMKFIYIPRANTDLHFASHSSASMSETPTKVVGCGLGSLQDCENLLLWEMDLMRVNVEPSEHILDCVGYYAVAWLGPGSVEADHAPIGFLVLRHKKSDVRHAAGRSLRHRMYYTRTLVETKFL